MESVCPKHMPCSSSKGIVHVECLVLPAFWKWKPVDCLYLYKWKWKHSLSETETVSFSSVQGTQCVGGRKSKQFSLYCVFPCVLWHRSHLCVTCTPLIFWEGFVFLFFYWNVFVVCLLSLHPLQSVISVEVIKFAAVFLWMVVWNSTREVHENKSSTVSHVIEYSLFQVFCRLLWYYNRYPGIPSYNINIYSKH